MNTYMIIYQQVDTRGRKSETHTANIKNAIGYGDAESKFFKASSNSPFTYNISQIIKTIDK